MPQHHELYRYCAPGQRSEKYALSGQQVRYLPGLEIRICTSRGAQPARLHVIAACHCHFYRTDQTFSHFNLCDRLGSITGVVDQAGQWVSRESGYPFGGTACWLTGSQAGASIKFQRYAGKERDITGLIYYGWRYYVPWQMRWLNSDPAGTIDGLNLFRMVGNNPLTISDRDGRMMEEDLTTDLAHIDNIIEEFSFPTLLPQITTELVDDVFGGDDAPLPGPSDRVTSRDKPETSGIKAPDTRPTFICDNYGCRYSTTSKVNFEVHRNKKPCDKFRVKCTMEGCNYATQYDNLLKKHMARRHEDKIYPCPSSECYQTFASPMYVDIHFKRCHQRKDFQCPNEGCHKEFANEVKFDRHLVGCEKKRCSVCTRHYKNKRTLYSHMQNKHPK